jgi:glycerophosphoryl diester phosphodiesterase
MSDKSSQVLIIGHRGANAIAPENTLKAFQKAIELKADYVEFDVHQSKDGEIVIIHDSDTLRTTRHKGSIPKMTLAEIKKLDAGEGEQIPTLDELIQIAKGKIGLQLEIKAPGMAQKIVDKLRSANLIESTIVSSFNHNELLEIQKVEPSLKLAALVLRMRKGKTLQKALDNDFSYIHPEFRFIKKPSIDAAHEKNIKVNAWTVNTRSNMKKLIEIGIDGIITNNIEFAREVLNRTE